MGSVLERVAQCHKWLKCNAQYELLVFVQYLLYLTTDCVIKTSTKYQN